MFIFLILSIFEIKKSNIQQNGIVFYNNLAY